MKLKQLETLFNRYHAPLHWFCMQYLHDREDADEIVNDVFVVLWEKREELEFSDAIRPLMYTIARNKSINHIKKKKPDFTELDGQFEVVSDFSDPLEILNARETEKQVHRLIGELPDRCRQIFILSRKEFMSNREIATVMEISEKTVENQITIAIRYIRQGLGSKKNSNGNTIPLIIFPWILALLQN